MLDYINHVIMPYLEKTRQHLSSLTILKGKLLSQLSSSSNTIMSMWCTLLPNTTDLLQPMNISVNKPATDYLRAQFDEWYSQEVTKQLGGRNLEDLEYIAILPINLSMPVMKEVSAKWLVDVVDRISEKPQLIVNGFVCSGITGAFDGNLDDTREQESDSGNESSQEDLSSDEH